MHCKTKIFLQIPIYRGSKYSLVQGIESDYYFGMDGLGDSETDFLEYESIEAQSSPAALALIEMSKKFEGKNSWC